MESKREIKKDLPWVREIDRAKRYFQSIGWSSNTGDPLEDYKSLLVGFKGVESNLRVVLDNFMKDKELKLFLLIHSVFKPDAIIHGEFIEYYMANQLRITEEQANIIFNRKTIPKDVIERFKGFDIEPVQFDIYPYRVEFGCRPDHETGERGYDPIRVIDLDFDVSLSEVVDTSKFLSQYEDIIL